MARDLYKYFRIEARDLTEQLGQSVLELERLGNEAGVVPKLLRLAHTLKGAARVVRLPEIAEHAHSIEGVLTPFRDAPGTVPAESIDTLLKLLDGIGSRLGALSPATPDNAPAAAQPQAGDVAGPLPTDAAEVDGLIVAVAGAATEVRALDRLAGDAASARRLAGQIAEQLAAIGGGQDAAGASVESLRTLLAQLERSLATAHARVERDLRQVHESAEQLRLVAASTLFPGLGRTARDSAQLLNKDVLFETAGGDTRLDAQIVRLVQDALLQLVRNAVAHGIEVPRDRTAAGKTPAGRVTVSVSRIGRMIVFRCSDDGRGVDVAALRAAAIRKGRAIVEQPGAPGPAIADLLLQGGVSTALSVSEVAGRGIGMDIVRETVARLNAGFAVKTEPGRGTTFELSVPLSLTAVDSLVMESAGSRALLPLSAVRRAVRLRPSDLHRTSAGEAMVDDGEAIPIIHLPEVLGRDAPLRRAANFTAVVIEGSLGRAALGIGRIAGTSSVIVRALPELAPATDVIAGASFDTDGSALLMLDPDGLVAAASRHRGATVESSVAKRPLLVIDDSLTTRMLEQSILLSAGYEVDVAVSAEEGLARVARRDYALILVDVEMPGMDGFGFIEALRRDPSTKHIPAILVTSRNAPEDKRRGMEAGAQDYVVKSEFDQAALLGRIRELMT